MKKLLSVLMALLLVAAMIPSVAASDYKASDVTAVNKGSNRGEYLTGFIRKGSFCIENVDLTGIKSVSMTADVSLIGGLNGQVYAIKLDDAVKGDVIGYLVLTENGQDKKYTCSIKPITGKHNVYFYETVTYQGDESVKIKKITFSDEEYVNPAPTEKVDDSFVKDIYSDTWVATDSLGRKVADYAEVGDVRSDKTVGIMYWNWFTSDTNSQEALIINDIVTAHPDAYANFGHEAWSDTAKYYWNEPLLGYYDSYDMWVYKKHAEMLAYAGVDVIFLDYSNTGLIMVRALNTLADAFREAKKEGVDVPKICVMMNLNQSGDWAMRGLSAIYFNCFVENDYSDLWFYWEGKPLIFGNCSYDVAITDVDSANISERALVKEMSDFFTFRSQGSRNNTETDGIVNDGKWMWLENFPQILRNPDETGKPEYMVVGASINQSTIYGLSMTGMASDPYSKGRGYSEVFGEDYSELGPRKAYFFREQAAFALENDPKFMMVDGWNEWTSSRFISYNVWTNAFCDTCDDDDSRDFEPTRGALKDDYYNLLVDFVRKYKGVRPLPLASGAKTIDIEGDLSQWNDVGPEFMAYAPDKERNSIGYLKADKSERHTYKAKAGNSVVSAKVSYDDTKLYFMATCRDAIDTQTEGFMNLYINADRNYATGWEGYDYAINLAGKGVVTANAANTWTWTPVANADMKINGNTLTLSVDRSAVGLTGEVDFEFKWTDSITPDGDLMEFYYEGSAAPYGRFNYRYAVNADTYLTNEQKIALKGSSVLAAGKTRMAVSGAVMSVYEPDTSVAPFEMNGTLYIPEDTFNEVMGYGRTKTEYNSTYNVMKSHWYTMSDDCENIDKNLQSYSTVGSYEAKVNGRAKVLSNPILADNGRIYFPLSYINECFGLNVQSLGNGIYVVGNADASVASAAAQIM